jgi:hypothetical protein
MQIIEVVAILQNRLIALDQARIQAAANGDIEKVSLIDVQMHHTQMSIDTINKGLAAE